MRCNKNDCFAYNIRWDNNCQALFDIEGCNFYKSKSEWTEQILLLQAQGKPLYNPSITRQDQRRLKALLQGGGKRGGENNLDKT